MATKYPKVRSYHGLLSLLRDPFSPRAYYRQIYIGQRASLELHNRTASFTGNLLLNYRSSPLMMWHKDNSGVLLSEFDYASYPGAKNFVNKFLPDNFKVVIEKDIKYLVHMMGKKRLKYRFHDPLVIKSMVVVNCNSGLNEFPV